MDREQLMMIMAAKWKMMNSPVTLKDAIIWGVKGGFKTQKDVMVQWTKGVFETLKEDIFERAIRKVLKP